MNNIYEVCEFEFVDVLRNNLPNSNVILHTTTIQTLHPQKNHVLYTDYEFERTCLNPLFKKFSVVQYAFNIREYTFVHKNTSELYDSTIALTENCSEISYTLLMRDDVSLHIDKTNPHLKDLVLSDYDKVFDANMGVFNAQKEWNDKFLRSLPKVLSPSIIRVRR